MKFNYNYLTYVASFFILISYSACMHKINGQCITKGMYTYEMVDDTLKNNEINVITGYVYDRRTNQPILGASIFLSEGNLQLITDSLGYFKVLAPNGKISLSVQYIGNNILDTKKINLTGNTKIIFNIELGSKVSLR